MGTQPAAKIIADSISPDGHRLTTMEVVMHRFVLAEFNTHRVFSRNSASSRAIPLRKQMERVVKDPAEPVSWPAEQRGMQGGEELDATGSGARDLWRVARLRALQYAGEIGDIGVHKSVANRLLEPFMWHTVVVTATAWENFFRLRCNPMAQPEIRVAAEAMKAAMDASKPVLIQEGQWHLPYVSAQDRIEHDFDELIKISSARCARVSYLTQDGVRDIEKDLALYHRLTSADPMHASPLEHVATPEPRNQHRVIASWNNEGPVLTLPVYGNFLGWHQHRYDVEAERGYRAYA